MRASFVMSGIGAGIRRNLSMTVALVLSTAIALAFVGAALLANTEISRFKTDYEAKLNVSIFMCAKVHNQPCTAETTPAQLTALQHKLDTDPLVESATLVTAQQNFERAKKTQPPEVARQIADGDLPASFTIKLKDITKDYGAFSAKYRDQPGVSQVQNRLTAIQKLLDVIDGVRLFSIVVALVVLVASILLIANTIQVAAAQRKNETSIMRLVGASRWMTELPFMIETIIATVVGGVIALGMVAIGKFFVFNRVFKVQVANGVIPNLNVNDLLAACGISLIAGVVLAAVTAFVTLRAYVRL